MENHFSPLCRPPSGSSARAPSQTASRAPKVSLVPKSWRLKPFLSAMWRSPDLHHQIGVLDPASGFRNIPVKDITEAVALAQQHDDAGCDVYFACAEYLTPDNRTAANVAGAWAFWMDVDCGPDKAADGKGYATVELADVAIQAFCKETGIPVPTHIGESGGGLHVYWVARRDLPRTNGRKRPRS